MQYAFPPQSEDITVGNVGVWGGSVDAFGRQDQCVTRCDQLLPSVTSNNPEGSSSSTSAALQRWIESTAVAAMMEKGLGNWERTLARWQPDKGGTTQICMRPQNFAIFLSPTLITVRKICTALASTLSQGFEDEDLGSSPRLHVVFEKFVGK